MATSVVTYQPAAGRAYVTLTSWAGTAAFTTTPVATNQIEGPNTWTLNADGTVTGADGTDTLRHIVATTGATEGISYTIGTVAAVPQGTITLGTATVDQTTISLPFTYSDTDQTGFEYRVDAGTWTATTNPVSLTGLTADTPYAIDVRAVNATGAGTIASTTVTTAVVPSSASTTVSLQPETGRSFVTLTSWAGDAAFATTPIAGDQIEYPDALTVGVDGVITGADGTYTLRHFQANGTVEGLSYTIGAVAQVPQGTITIGTATIGETTASIPFTYDLSDQTGFEYRKGAEAWASTTSPVTLSNLTAETAYTVEIRAVNATGSGTAASTNITTLAAGTGPSSATTTVSFAAPTGKSVSTLITGFDPYIFQNWASQPVVGEQIIATDAELTVSNLADVTTDLEGVFDVWFVRLDGTTHALTIDTTGLTAVDAADTTPAPFTVAALTDQPLSQYVEFAPVAVSDIDAGETIAVTVTGSGVQYSVNAGAGYGGYTSTSTGVKLGDLVMPRILTPDAFETTVAGSISIGSESSALSATTRAAILPTLIMAIPDLSLGQGDVVSLDIGSYFTGATSYSVTGFPAGSGLSFSGSTISGNANASDTSASPFTLTVTAINADGSVADSFGLTVVDDIAPTLIIYSMTTLNTSPIVFGACGDAVSLILVVNGVTYNPAPSGGTWSQQLPILPLATYEMTLDGQDAAGNVAAQVKANLHIVDTIVSTATGYISSLIRPAITPMIKDIAA